MKRYLNFDLELSSYAQTGNRETLKARVLKSPVGGQRERESCLIAFPSALRSNLAKLQSRELDLDGLILFGEALSELLLPLPVREFYRNSLARLREGEGLRIRVRADSPEIALLPWEYAYVGRPDTPASRKRHDGFLVLDRRISLVRYEVLDEPEQSIGAESPKSGLRVAALLSDVRDSAYAPLNLVQEEVNLRQAFDGVVGIDVSYLRPGTLEQLEELLSTDGAQIFHFAGHGEFAEEMGEKPGTVEGRGRLIFSGDDRQPAPLDVERLALELRRRGIRLCVLSACEAARRDALTLWSGVAPALVRQGIPAVVGMQYTVRDNNAVAFSRRFYRALAHGHSIDTAVSEGRLGILQRGGGVDRDWGVPVMYLRTSRAVLFPKPVKPLLLNLVLLLAAVSLTTVWFYLHIYPLFAYSTERWLGQIGLTFGAVAGIATIFKMMSSWVARRFGSREESVSDAWLRHKHSRKFIVSLLVAASFLLGTTYSIYLTLDTGDVDAVELAINTEEGDRWNPLPRLYASQPDRTLVGGPVWMQAPPGELSVSVVKPEGWSLRDDKRTFRLSPVRSIKLNVSGDLQMIERRVVRIASRSNLIELLAGPGDPNPSRSYSLRVAVDGEEVSSLSDFRQGIVYVGDSKQRMLNLLNEERPIDRKENLKRCVYPRNDANVEAMMQIWEPEDERHRMFVDTPALRPGQSLLIHVYDVSDGEPERLVAEKLIPVDTLEVGAITSICLAKILEPS